MVWPACRPHLASWKSISFLTICGPHEIDIQTEKNTFWHYKYFFSTQDLGKRSRTSGDNFLKKNLNFFSTPWTVLSKKNSLPHPYFQTSLTIVNNQYLGQHNLYWDMSSSRSSFCFSINSYCLALESKTVQHQNPPVLPQNGAQMWVQKNVFCHQYLTIIPTEPVTCDSTQYQCGLVWTVSRALDCQSGVMALMISSFMSWDEATLPSISSPLSPYIKAYISNGVHLIVAVWLHLCWHCQ